MADYPLRIFLVGIFLVIVTGCAEPGPNLPVGLWHIYEKYQTQPHYRAMACVRGTTMVGCARAYGQPSPQAAVDLALNICRKEQEKQVERAPCSLRFVGDIDVSGMERSQIAGVLEQYQREASPGERAPGIWPGPVAGIAGVTVRKVTFATVVQDALPVDDVTAISFSEGSFHIHVKWELNLSVVKQFIVRCEVFDAADRLVTNRSIFHAPESPRWNTWQRINFTKLNQPGKWKVSIYVSTGPGEAKVGETYLTVKPD